MQRLAEICLRRPVFASMLILSLVVVGSVGYWHLGVDRSPSVDLPTVNVRTTLPGASPAEVEAQVSQRIEEAVNTIEGIKELRSISGMGSSFIIVTFELNRNIEAAAQDVRERVATVVRDLPREADPPIISKLDNDQTPILSIALSGDRSPRELTELADKVVKVQLERSAGVGEVEIVGGVERAISIWVDADRLAAYQIPITAVRDAIVSQNAESPGGNVTSGLRERTLRTLGKVSDPAKFNDLVVATVNGTPIRIKDVGRAEDGTKEMRKLARLNGVPAVTLDVKRQSGANTVDVISGVKSKFASIEGELPPDVKLEVIRDQSNYILEAQREIQVHLVAGSLLACLVVLMFMKDWRATVIAGVAIPTSVIATFGMMWALGFTLNSVTMLALVLMVGIVIDDAIVVLENIFRFVEEKKMDSWEAARAATEEIGLAVLATTLSLVVIFVPVSFMSSISGRFLYQFGITAAVAVLVSLLVSFTLTPVMSARLFRRSRRGGADGPRSRSGIYGYVDRGYERLLRFSLGHRVLVLGVSGVLMLSSVPLYSLIRQEYVPSNADEGEIDLNVRAPEGLSLAAMDELTRVVESELRDLPGVDTVLASVGSGLGGLNQVRAFIKLKPHSERLFSFGRLAYELSRGRPLAAFRDTITQQSVVKQIRQRLSRYPALRPSIRPSQSFNLGGSGAEIDFSLLGPDLKTLGDYAERLRKLAPDIGVVDADITLKLDSPETRVAIDRARAADLGVAVADVATALRLMVGGDPRVSRFRDEAVNDDYDVQLRLTDTDRKDEATIARLYVPAKNGALVRLDNLVEITAGQGASRIDRLDRQRQVSLRGSVAPGYGLADRIEALRDAAAKLEMPAGYSTRVVGRGRELETTFREFLWAFLLSVLFMYMILASQYESLLDPLIILLSLPLTVPFALFTLWAAQGTLNLYSALGLLVLFGVVKKNAILQVDHMNHLRRSGLEPMVAIVQANRDRLRPILMTTLTFVVGMLPLAIGNGPGAEERRATALVIIGGQSLSLLLTLLVTPVAYSLLTARRSISIPRSPGAVAPEGGAAWSGAGH
ncbi:MAG: efflux RND transporter permease subunit [Verrucomicrobiales bacterium]|nr:efflux RND transporter permease subunit [Verrucomicrobiales bacterium]